ncbi:type IX secretion system sortase PorU [Fulvivirga sp. 29W222]|uniref:Type IX secretion system sortase PorU n=1 Tax=Fulvivirga marina TaxID=2494733 RepID=A0A937FT39_9BACT|nr:type IX secretion system sortase PorU [Fulvivirga marina]MBL6444929.1 type IX secretion system sortase PorU [Fulvivirga marina]
MTRNLRVIIILFYLFTFSQAAISQDNSVLSSGDWFKLTIEKDGVYKITHSKLQEMGIDVASIDPRKIQVYGNGSGMLPQANSIERPADLTQNAIYISGENDGKFDNGDYILIYAQGADSYSYEGGILNYQHNIYSNQNYYFLTIGTDNGLRISSGSNLGTSFPKIQSYNTFRYHEVDEKNILGSGRKWYESNPGIQTYNFKIDGLIPNTTVTVTSAVMAQSFAESKFKLTLNDIAAGEQIIGSIPDFNKKQYLYSVKGNEDLSQFMLNSNDIGSGNLAVKLEYIGNSSGYAAGFLDYLIIEAKCHLKLTQSMTIFRSTESSNNTSSTFEISDATAQTMIWDISDPLAAKNQPFTFNQGKASFGTETSAIKEFIAFDPAKLLTPEIIKIPNQNIRGISTPDLLIVTHPNFLPEAKRLAQFRRSNDNLSVAVVTTEQVYNEFSSGKQDVTAIRDYTKYLYGKTNRLKYLLLFGRGSYDYKNILQKNNNYVPVYESRNSLYPLDTYTSDDYFGFMESDEGEWQEKSGGNHTMEIGVGRLPVTSLKQAKTVVDKLISYSTDPEALGHWRNDIAFVADDGDANTHTSQSDQLTVLIDTAFSDFNYNKFFLDAYPQISTPSKQTSPKAKEALTKLVSKGALVINFTGHGREVGWTEEEILDTVMIRKWDNIKRLPLFVTATCEFGRHDDPTLISGGEKLVTNSKGGGIGIISTCRPVFSSSNFALNKAFYNELFRITDDQYPRLGDIIRITKNNSVDKAIDANKVGNRNFGLLGDPSLRLSYPKKKVVLTSINGNANKSDTLKALSKVKIQGEIQEVDGLKSTEFNGTLETVIYDKESEFVTLGQENTPYTYKSRKNVIFRGTSTISNGEFTVEFVVPKNISYQAGTGKISLYAFQKTQNDDANGSDIEIVVGGTAINPPQDNTGPNIQLYLGDSTYRGTGEVNPNTMLVARLSDESGINISGYGVGNNITAILDDKNVYNLNEYYIASQNTYKTGWVSFPLNNLEKGKHTLTLKAWDTYNNPGKSEIEFVVGEEGSISLSNLRAFPNPFSSNTTIAFEHSRSGEDLQVNLQIISRSGEILRDMSFEIQGSTSDIELFNWDGTNIFGQKVPGGIYLFKIMVRSMSDGGKNQGYEKLILIN